MMNDIQLDVLRDYRYPIYPRVVVCHKSCRRSAAVRNPYLRLLCQLYKFLARRSESKFNKVQRIRIRALDHPWG